MGERMSKETGPETMSECRNYNISLVDLIQWQKDMLLQSNSKDSLTQEQFILQYRKTFPKGDAKSFAKNVFRLLDSNGDGELNIEELVLAISTLTSDDEEAKMDWAFRYYDVNGDGYITRAELKKLVIPIIKMQTAEKLTNKDLEEQVNDLFRSMNTDCDAGITIGEFRRGCMKHPYLYHGIRLV